MKRGNRILIILVVIIIILVAIAGFVVYRNGGVIASSGPTATSVSPMVDIVIPKQPINLDDQITDSVLTTTKYDQSMVTVDMIRDPKQIVGKYALFNLKPGVYLTSSMFADRPGMNQPGSEAAKVVSPGMVAISLPINRLSAVSYAVKDGDRVNVIATTMFLDVDSSYQTMLPNLTSDVKGVFTPERIVAGAKSNPPYTDQGRVELDPSLNVPFYLIPREDQRPRLSSQTILQNVQVLHIGDFPLVDQKPGIVQPTPAPGEQTATPTAGSGPVYPEVITLIVSPQDAVALTYLMYSNAKFTLTLRAPDDTSRVETEAATLQYLLSQYAIPVPAKLPYVIDNSKINNPATSLTPAP